MNFDTFYSCNEIKKLFIKAHSGRSAIRNKGFGMSLTNVLVSNVSNIINYDSYTYRNDNICKNSFILKMIRNKDALKDTPGLYNQFFDELPENVSGWIIFCHEDFEFTADPLATLKNADQGSVYGVLGVRRLINLRGDKINECVGNLCCVDDKNGTRQTLGVGFPKDTSVDYLSFQCIIVHSSLVAQLALRFDLQPQADLPIQSYPLTGTQPVPCKVIDIPCLLHNKSPLAWAGQAEDPARSNAPQADNTNEKHTPQHSASETLTGPAVINVLVSEEQNHDNFVIYHRPVNPADANTPVVLAANMMDKNSCVLDVGCAAGDTGIFLRDTIAARLWGMEYNERSIAHAKKSNVYDAIHHVDLNQFSPSDYGSYYGFFDHIMMADVLEHTIDPLVVLKKMRHLLRGDGSMLVSLPNVGHAYLIGQLLQSDFHYHDWGILDKTHLRFFTWKSMAELFAQAGLAVEQSNATFLIPDSYPTLRIPKNLPAGVYEHLAADKHFLVCQYISKLKTSSLPEQKLLQHNMKLLKAAPENNPEGLAQKKPQLTALHNSVKHPGSIKALSERELHHVESLLQAKKYIEAIIAAKLFDEQWYREHNNDLDFTLVSPLPHYLTAGWREGRNPSAHFDTQWYRKKYPDAANSDICPLLHFIMFGLKLQIPCSAKQYTPKEEEFQNYAMSVSSQAHTKQDSDYKDITIEPYTPEKDDTKLIAFYLPQFYPFAENDKWWGKGFTEWTNAAKATPQFSGHYQPHHPIDLGFYDLRLEETVLRQAELAKTYGIHGFCYYQYWFSGTKIMDMPMTRMLNNKQIDLPFCICWANEPWSARWDGKTGDILINQSKSIDFEKYFDEIIPFFLDPRYIKVAEKPLYLVHRPTFFARDHFRDFIEQLRKAAQKNGLPGVHVAVALSDMNAGPYALQDFNADAFVEFPPSKVAKVPLYDIRVCNPKFKGYIFDMRQLVSIYKTWELPRELTYRTVFPMWDNTARRAELHAWIFANSSPQLYQDWLGYCIETTKKHNPPASNIVFINAWNEWGEGAHLEPDKKYGYAYLEATRNALLQTR